MIKAKVEHTDKKQRDVYGRMRPQCHQEEGP